MKREIENEPYFGVFINHDARAIVARLPRPKFKSWLFEEPSFAARDFSVSEAFFSRPHDCLL